MEILMNDLSMIKRLGKIASPEYAVVAMQETKGYLNVVATDGFIICMYRLPTYNSRLQGKSAQFGISPVGACAIGCFAQQMLSKEVVKAAQVEIAENLSIACDGVQVSVKLIEDLNPGIIIAKMDELMSRTPPVRFQVNVKRALKEIKPGKLTQPSPATLSIECDRASILYAGNKWSVRGKPLGYVGRVTATVDLRYLMDALRAVEEINSTVIIGMSDDKSPIFVGDDKSEGIRFAQFIMPMSK